MEHLFLKRNNFLFTFFCVIFVFALNDKSIASKSNDVIKELGYKVFINKHGYYKTIINSLRFNEASSLDVFKKYFLNAQQVEKSMRETGTIFKGFEIRGIDLLNVNNCNVLNFEIVNTTKKKILLYSVPAKLTFNCSLSTLGDGSCVQKCVMKKDEQSESKFNMKDEKRFPCQVIRCKKDNLASSLCTIETTGIVESVLTYSASDLSLSGTIVNLRSNVNLAIQSFGDYNNETVSNKNKNYVNKIDYWSTAKNSDFDGSGNKLIIAETGRDNYVVQ